MRQDGRKREMKMNAELRRVLTFAAAATLGATPVAAQQGGVLTSKVELEKEIPGAHRTTSLYTYVEPKVVVPGDRVRVTLTFTNNSASPATGLNITNPIPAGLFFNGTDDTTDFSVSVDGGKSFGALSSLTLPVANAAPRAATLTDVTHVRWLWVKPVAPQQNRSVAFFGLVK